MFQLFLFSMIDGLASIGNKGVFIIIVSALGVFTLLCLALCVFTSQYSLKKRGWIVFCYLSLLAFELWAEISIKEDQSYILLTFAICMICLSVIMFLPQMSKKIEENHKVLARYLDNCAKQVLDNQPLGEDSLEPLCNSNSSCQDILSKMRQADDDQTIIKTQVCDNQLLLQENKQEIDFEHVKSILERLQYFSISNQDKQSAKELEDAIVLAENNGLNMPLKQKINDGLGALLKIMSKYAI